MKRSKFQVILGLSQGQAYDILANAVARRQVAKEPNGHYNDAQCEALIADILERRQVTKPQWVQWERKYERT